MESAKMAGDTLENDSDYHDSDGFSDLDSDIAGSTPLTAVQTPRTPRPSDLKVHDCPYEGCTKSFNRLARLVEHQRSHTGERIFKCREEGCCKDFLRESHLKHHIKSAHSDIRDYVCNWEGCGKSFATGTRLRRHMAAHEGREKYRCRGYDGCNETFRKHATLTRHILTVHEGQKAFPCSETDQETGERCIMAFDTAEKLRSHQRVKHDPTRFSCSICLDAILANNLQESENDTDLDGIQAYFPTYALLQGHIADIHPPTCPHCMTTCSTQRELRRHIEGVHGLLSIEDPGSWTPGPVYHCTYPSCGRTFNRKSNLNAHVNTVHKGQRAFICGETDLTKSRNVPFPARGTVDSCGRSFTSKSSLEEHMRTAHLGLHSRQTERKRKRKAAEVASQADDEMEDSAAKKKKSPARQKKTPLANLTGINDKEMGTVEISQVGQVPETLGMCLDQDSLPLELTGGQTSGYEIFPGYQPYYLQSIDSGALQETDNSASASAQSCNLDNDDVSSSIDPLLLLT